MSHYSTISTCIKDQSHLISALKSMGFKDNQIQSGESLKLNNYTGRDSGRKAQVRIDKKHIGGYINDLGFERQEDGSFTMHGDLGSKYGGNDAFSKKLTQHYSVSIIKQTAEERGFFIEEETEVNGEIFLTATTSMF